MSVTKGLDLRLDLYGNFGQVNTSNAGSGSDRFVGGNRFGLFPAVSAGWNISEEEFFRAVSESPA
ncbi:hypothetical protein ACFSUS_11625 [Spirosoma soli]|uniref:TonB-dependent receptor n=1 Tax=Spirosoma soli TaxID=1770529 RepID=A0ABW5M4P1_9BACT